MRQTQGAVRSGGVYGPVQRQTRDTWRGQVRVEFDASEGACADLLTSVADRYFGANAATQRFEHATARMICHGCPVKVECLADAIAAVVPRYERRVRGGESAHAQADYRHEYLTSRESPMRIAQRVIDHQLPPIRGAYGSPDLRAGQFASPRPLR